MSNLHGEPASDTAQIYAAANGTPATEEEHAETFADLMTGTQAAPEVPLAPATPQA